MSEQIPIAEVRSIRECGFNETWLQDQIAENPACLQLSELELVSRERQQLGGGRMDILLTDPEDDSMYEVEVMFGETDESHIVRTIEYWDREKRRWPQRQHFAVLVYTRKNQYLCVTVAKQTIKSNAAIFQEFAKLATQNSGT
ncbi:MAG: hypothetical protein ACLP9L_41950 [Thermoguttaceae bacterium]